MVSSGLKPSTQRRTSTPRAAVKLRPTRPYGGAAPRSSQIGSSHGEITEGDDVKIWWTISGIGAALTGPIIVVHTTIALANGFRRSAVQLDLPSRELESYTSALTVLVFGPWVEEGYCKWLRSAYGVWYGRAFRLALALAEAPAAPLSAIIHIAKHMWMGECGMAEGFIAHISHNAVCLYHHLVLSDGDLYKALPRVPISDAVSDLGYASFDSARIAAIDDRSWVPTVSFGSVFLVIIAWFQGVVGPAAPAATAAVGASSSKGALADAERVNATRKQRTNVEHAGGTPPRDVQPPPGGWRPSPQKGSSLPVPTQVGPLADDPTMFLTGGAAPRPSTGAPGPSTAPNTAGQARTPKQIAADAKRKLQKARQAKEVPTPPKPTVAEPKLTVKPLEAQPHKDGNVPTQFIAPDAHAPPEDMPPPPPSDSGSISGSASACSPYTTVKDYQIGWSWLELLMGDLKLISPFDKADSRFYLLGFRAFREVTVDTRECDKLYEYVSGHRVTEKTVDSLRNVAKELKLNDLDNVPRIVFQRMLIRTLMDGASGADKASVPIDRLNALGPASATEASSACTMSGLLWHLIMSRTGFLRDSTSAVNWRFLLVFLTSKLADVVTSPPPPPTELSSAPASGTPGSFTATLMLTTALLCIAYSMTKLVSRSSTSVKGWYSFPKDFPSGMRLSLLGSKLLLSLATRAMVGRKGTRWR